MRRKWITRFGLVAAVASTMTVGFASAAHAVAENKVWVTSYGRLIFEYHATAPASHLVVRNSGDTVTVTDSFGLAVGPGCSYPTQYATLVHCVGVNQYQIGTGPGNDSIDVLFSGTHARMGGQIDAGEGDSVGPDVENVWGTQANDIIIGSPAANFLDGRAGNDYLFGVDGDDRLLGGIGDDYLYGANGADALDGDVGSDLCDLGTDGLTRVNCER